MAPGQGNGQEGVRSAQGPRPSVPQARPLLPSHASPLRHPPVPGSGSLAVSGVLPFLTCKFKMCLQSIFHPRPSLPPRLRAASLGAGLSPRRGAQVSIATGLLMPASPEVPRSDWGVPALHPRALLTTGGWAKLSSHRPDIRVSVSLRQAGTGPSNRFSLIIAKHRPQPFISSRQPFGLCPLGLTLGCPCPLFWDWACSFQILERTTPCSLPHLPPTPQEAGGLPQFLVTSTSLWVILHHPHWVPFNSSRRRCHPTSGPLHMLRPSPELLPSISPTICPFYPVHANLAFRSQLNYCFLQESLLDFPA